MNFEKCLLSRRSSILSLEWGGPLFDSGVILLFAPTWWATMKTIAAPTAMQEQPISTGHRTVREIVKISTAVVTTPAMAKIAVPAEMLLSVVVASGEIPLTTIRGREHLEQGR
jgi:hypothetical protein